jgi:sugar phosphate isomerase/epimerase
LLKSHQRRIIFLWTFRDKRQFDSVRRGASWQLFLKARMSLLSPLQISFSTLACPDWSWPEILRHGPEFGYQGVEVRLLERDTDLLQRPEFQPDQLALRRAELAAADFQVVGLGSSVRFDYPEEQTRQEQVRIGRRYIDLAHQLHSKFVRVFGDVFTAGHDAQQREQVLSQIVEGLSDLGHYAEPLGVLVLMETHGDFADSTWMQTVMERVAHPAVGVLWDTHHPWRFYNEPLSETFNRLSPWIRHTHWKDSRSHAAEPLTPDAAMAAAQAHSLMSGHKAAHYVLFGEGEFPAKETLRLLDAAGYDGWHSLEWELAWHPELAQPEIALPDFPTKLVALAEAVRNERADR